MRQMQTLQMQTSTSYNYGKKHIEQYVHLNRMQSVTCEPTGYKLNRPFLTIRSSPRKGSPLKNFEANCEVHKSTSNSLLAF